MTAPRPTAVGYVGASTERDRSRQHELLAAHATSEGMSLAHVVEDPRDVMTLSEVLEITDKHGAVRLVLPAGVPMAARHRSLTELLARIGAACVVIPEPVVPARMVALDIDGTLTPEGRPDVPEATVRAVAAARAAGHHIVLATGRSVAGALPIARRLRLRSGWVVASNGATTTRLDPEAQDGYVVRDISTLAVEPVVRHVLALIPGVQVGAEDTGRGYRVTSLFEADRVPGAQRVVGLDQLWAEPTARLILAAPGAARLLLEPVRALGLTANPAGPDWVDVTPPGLSKASALETVRVALGVRPEHTIAVGDGVNDIEMLRWAGDGVAMGHAPAVVRDAADRTTGSLTDNGVIDIVTALLTIPTPAEVTS